MNDEIEYEEEKPLMVCGTCRFWTWDTWYQGERICDCGRSLECGEPKIAEDRCDWWEGEDE